MVVVGVGIEGESVSTLAGRRRVLVNKSFTSQAWQRIPARPLAAAFFALSRTWPVHPSCPSLGAVGLGVGPRSQVLGVQIVKNMCGVDL